MEVKMKRNIYFLGLVLLGSLARLLPHPPNFTPTGALAFFGGNKISNKWIALLVPLAILFLSDAILGWHKTMPFVYGSFVLTALLGKRLGSSLKSRAGGLLLSSLIFFVISNFGVWLTSGMYPHTTSGFFLCYAAALPFLRNEVVSTLVYGFAFFVIASLIEKKALKTASVPS